MIAPVHTAVVHFLYIVLSAVMRMETSLFSAVFK